jgi:parallel beta-helix repeat protein
MKMARSLLINASSASKIFPQIIYFLSSMVYVGGTLGLKCVFLLLFLFVATVLRVSPMIAARADTNIIRVPNDFPTIQDAINAAQNGNTILVNSGVYDENLIIDKTLVLLGTDEQTTIIEGSSGATHGLAAVSINNAENVVVNGFTMTDGSTGIDLQYDSGCVISGNIITQNPFGGIELDRSYNNTISGNIISLNGAIQPGFSFGHGISLSLSSNNTISNNIINDNLINLILDSGTNNAIFGNVIEDNMPANIIDAVGGSNNTVFNNDFMGSLPSSYNGYCLDASSPAISWSSGGRGNYWIDYTGLDDGSGGRVAGDGVGDTNLPWQGVDYYPLINPTNPFGILWGTRFFRLRWSATAPFQRSTSMGRTRKSRST